MANSSHFTFYYVIGKNSKDANQGLPALTGSLIATRRLYFYCENYDRLIRHGFVENYFGPKTHGNSNFWQKWGLIIKTKL